MPHQPSPLPDPEVCARCAARFPTCCRVKTESVECCFPLSGLEQAAIRAHAGSDAVMTRQDTTPLFLANMQDLFPGERSLIAANFVPDGWHWRLALAPDGACVFLRPDGCALPREVRPAYCRIFPFWVRGREIWHFSLRECQAQRELRGRPALQRCFGLSDADVLELYAIVRRGWGLPPRPVRQAVPEDLFRYSSSK